MLAGATSQTSPGSVDALTRETTTTSAQQVQAENAAAQQAVPGLHDLNLSAGGTDKAAGGQSTTGGTPARSAATTAGDMNTSRAPPAAQPQQKPQQVQCPQILNRGQSQNERIETEAFSSLT